jgi:hypothetical protein
MNTKTIAIIAVTTSILGAGILRLSGSAPARASSGDAPLVAELGMSPAQRGKYIVDTAGCHDCHTPVKMGKNGPEPDMSRMLSGHPEAMKMPPAPPAQGPWIASVSATMTAWSGPWGTSFTANLTPDRATGLGTWTEENFVKTIRTGRHMGSGRPLLPPMPVPVYNNFTDDDLKAIYAYLRTVPAVKNRVPQPLPPPATVQ